MLASWGDEPENQRTAPGLITLDGLLSRIDEAIARLERALGAVRQIPQQGQDGVKVDGIEHELTAIAERLQSLRDHIAGGDERAG
jgi:hypothetical protein